MESVSEETKLTWRSTRQRLPALGAKTVASGDPSGLAKIVSVDAVVFGSAFAKKILN